MILTEQEPSADTYGDNTGEADFDPRRVRADGERGCLIKRKDGDSLGRAAWSKNHENSSIRSETVDLKWDALLGSSP